MKNIDYKDLLQKRNEIIERLDNKLINKEQFIKENIMLYDGIDIDDNDTDVDSYEKGIILYQYYNIMAKQNKALYAELKYKNPFVAVEHRKLSDKLYANKERVTYKLISFLEFKNMICYKVKADSKKLKNTIVEIVLTNYDKAILHTLDARTIKVLKDKGLLSDKLEVSKIDSYINSKYYKNQ